MELLADKIIAWRNAISHVVYAKALKPIFFRDDPEKVHDAMVKFGARLGKPALTRGLVRAAFGYRASRLEQTVLGIHFANPIGLSAGFDKDAELTDVIPSVGFGFMEVGSITGNASVGNPKPRLWRLKKSRGLLVYYGLKNLGAEAISRTLKEKIKIRRKNFPHEDRQFAIPLGTSVAMTNCKENLDTSAAIADYAKAFRAFSEIGAYFTINISCPNAQGGQPFVEPEKLAALLDVIDRIETRKPIFVKLSPDMTHEQVDALLAIVRRHRVHGIICTNLTKNRDNRKILDKDLPPFGGISGKPVQEFADDLLAYIYQSESRREKDEKEMAHAKNFTEIKDKSGRLVLIGTGGVFTAEDAYRKIRLGASLVQIITGMIFEGPQVVSEINRGLAALLKRDGFATLAEAIGDDHRRP